MLPLGSNTSSVALEPLLLSLFFTPLLFFFFFSVGILLSMDGLSSCLRRFGIDQLNVLSWELVRHQEALQSEEGDTHVAPQFRYCPPKFSLARQTPERQLSHQLKPKLQAKTGMVHPYPRGRRNIYTYVYI